ncbi:MAG: PTS sugar transporter subunit IIC [Spirochaetota bacterium]|nr:PTS sugar transporter subunit IIC [Spirochaetota bacterium]
MNITWIQIISLSLLAFFSIYDELAAQFVGTRPVVVGAIAGLIMGDLETGLMIGGTLHLLVLGVGALGGTSIPDYTTGAIIGTAFAVATGTGNEIAIGLAVPVGLLMIQLDILARFTNVFFQKRIDAAIERLDIKSIERNVIMGIFPWGLSRAIPVFLMLSFGSQFIEGVLANIPEVIMGGLKLAGSVLPAVGLAVLTRFLPVKKFIPALIIGFVLTAYLEISVLGVALVGLSLAMAYYQFATSSTDTIIVNQETISGEGEYED